MKDAGNTKAHSMWRERAIFILLYVISIFVEAMAMVPGLLVYIASRPDAASWFGQAGSSGAAESLWSGSIDMDKYSALLQTQPEWLMIYTLFAEIVLIAFYAGYCRLIEKRSFPSMGFTRGHIVVQYIKGLLWAVVLFGGAYLLCVGTGAVHFGGVSADMIPGYIVLYFVGYMIQGMAEEVICRGYLLVSLSRNHSVWYSVVISSGVFMAMHMSNDHMTLLAFINIFLCGLLFGLIFVERGNIWMVAALHSGWNFLQNNIFGIPVSGMAQGNSVFTTTFVDGRSLINGGAFGAEGGIAVTVVLALGIYITYRRMDRKGMLVAPEEPGSVEQTVAAEKPEPLEEAENLSGPSGYPKEENDYTSMPLNLDTLNRIETQKREAGIGKEPSGETINYPRSTIFNADYFREKDEE